VEDLIEKDLYYRFKEELEILDGLMPSLDLKQVHAGKQTPVFFGSAMTQFWGGAVSQCVFGVLSAANAPRKYGWADFSRVS
jgi:peptide subunit release factor RF-3